MGEGAGRGGGEKARCARHLDKNFLVKKKGRGGQY